jgi:hypothetical protein
MPGSLQSAFLAHHRLGGFRSPVLLKNLTVRQPGACQNARDRRFRMIEARSGGGKLPFGITFMCMQAKTAAI